MTETTDPGGVQDQVRAEARARVDRQEYPDDLESHLDRHYHEIVRDGRGQYARRLREEVGRLRANVDVAWEPVETASRLPGGGSAHRFVAASLERQLGPLVAQLREFTAAVASILELEADALAELRAQVSAIADETARMDEEGLHRSIAGLEARVAALEASLRRQSTP